MEVYAFEKLATSFDLRDFSGKLNMLKHNIQEDSILECMAYCFALDKLKELEIKMIEKYTKDTEITIHNLVSDAIYKNTNNKGTSGKFIYVNNK